MKKETGIKYVVKVISITKPLQKIHFTVRHPEAALSLTGIAVTGTKYQKAFGEYARFSDTTGVISLAIPEKGDVFYTQEIKTENGVFLETIEQKVVGSFAKREFAFSGKRYDYFDTCLTISDASIEGYYEDFTGDGNDFIRPLGVIYPHPEPIPVKQLYKVTLYLRYQMKEEKQTG